MGSTRRAFTDEYRAHAVELVINDGRTIVDVARGIEVHAVTAAGHLVVTMEGNDEQEVTQTFDRLNAIPGVHATTLVYHHSETLDDESPAEKESKP